MSHFVVFDVKFVIRDLDYFFYCYFDVVLIRTHCGGFSVSLTKGRWGRITHPALVLKQKHWCELATQSSKPNQNNKIAPVQRSAQVLGFTNRGAGWGSWSKSSVKCNTLAIRGADRTTSAAMIALSFVYPPLIHVLLSDAKGDRCPPPLASLLGKQLVVGDPTVKFSDRYIFFLASIFF